jgi:hypothetical protein
MNRVEGYHHQHSAQGPVQYYHTQGAYHSQSVHVLGQGCLPQDVPMQDPLLARLLHGQGPTEPTGYAQPPSAYLGQSAMLMTNNSRYVHDGSFLI